MSTLQLALAVVLLTSPPESRPLVDAPAVFHFVAPSLKWLAMSVELLDDKETEYFKNEEDFRGDLKLIQSRWAELNKAPLVAEVSRFPNRELTNDFLHFNRAYNNSLNELLKLDVLHADELRIIIAENEHLFHVYDVLRDARSEYLYIASRRQALAKLRDIIGQEAFVTGQLPPHVPLWRIPEAQ